MKNHIHSPWGHGRTKAKLDHAKSTYHKAVAKSSKVFACIRQFEPVESPEHKHDQRKLGTQEQHRLEFRRLREKLNLLHHNHGRDSNVIEIPSLDPRGAPWNCETEDLETPDPETNHDLETKRIELLEPEEIGIEDRDSEDDQDAEIQRINREMFDSMKGWTGLFPY